MPTYEVRNRRSKMVLGEVTVDAPNEVLDALLKETSSTIEDLAFSLGGTMEEIAAALDIVEVKPVYVPPERGQASRPLAKSTPARRRSLYVAERQV